VRYAALLAAGRDDGAVMLRRRPEKGCRRHDELPSTPCREVAVGTEAEAMPRRPPMMATGGMCCPEPCSTASPLRLELALMAGGRGAPEGIWAGPTNSRITAFQT